MGPGPVVLAMVIWLSQGLDWVVRSLVAGPALKCGCCGGMMRESYLDLELCQFGNVYGRQWWRCANCGHRTSTEYSNNFWLR